MSVLLILMKTWRLTLMNEDWCVIFNINVDKLFSLNKTVVIILLLLLFLPKICSVCFCLIDISMNIDGGSRSRLTSPLDSDAGDELVSTESQRVTGDHSDVHLRAEGNKHLHSAAVCQHFQAAVGAKRVKFTRTSDRKFRCYKWKLSVPLWFSREETKTKQSDTTRSKLHL